MNLNFSLKLSVLIVTHYIRIRKGMDITKNSKDILVHLVLLDALYFFSGRRADLGISIVLKQAREVPFYASIRGIPLFKSAKWEAPLLLSPNLISTLISTRE